MGFFCRSKCYNRYRKTKKKDCALWKVAWIYIDDIIDKFEESYCKIKDIQKNTQKNK